MIILFYNTSNNTKFTKYSKYEILGIALIEG